MAKYRKKPRVKTQCGKKVHAVRQITPHFVRTKCGLIDDIKLTYFHFTTDSVTCKKCLKKVSCSKN